MNIKYRFLISVYHSLSKVSQLQNASDMMDTLTILMSTLQLEKEHSSPSKLSKIICDTVNDTITIKDGESDVLFQDRKKVIRDNILLCFHECQVNVNDVVSQKGNLDELLSQADNITSSFTDLFYPIITTDNKKGISLIQYLKPLIYSLSYLTLFDSDEKTCIISQFDALISEFTSSKNDDDMYKSIHTKREQIYSTYKSTKPTKRSIDIMKQFMGDSNRDILDRYILSSVLSGLKSYIT